MFIDGYVDENGKYHEFEYAKDPFDPTPTPGQCCGAAIGPTPTTGRNINLARRIEPYSLMVVVKNFLKVFTQEQRFIVNSLPPSIRALLSYERATRSGGSGYRTISDVTQGSLTRDQARSGPFNQYISRTNLLKILGYDPGEIKNAPQTFNIPRAFGGTRINSYYKLGHGLDKVRQFVGLRFAIEATTKFMNPALLKIRTNYIKCMNNLDFASMSFYRFLDDMGVRVKFGYKIFETVNKYSESANVIGWKEIGRLVGIDSKIPGIRQVAMEEPDAIIKRLVNIFLLRPNDVASLKISAKNLKKLKEDIYHISLGILFETGKVDSNAGLDKFKMLFNTLLALNFKEGNGHVIKGIKNIISLSDLSAKVSSKGNRGGLLQTMRKPQNYFASTCRNIQDILKLEGLTASNIPLKIFFDLNDLTLPIDVIDSYLLKYRPWAAGDYHQYFRVELLIPHAKEMIDITLGLDVLTKTFILNQDKLHIHRHHPDRDKPWFTVFQFDSQSGDFKVKLIPITDWKHLQLHGYYKIYGDFQKYTEENDLARARVEHLAEMIYRQPYRSGIDYHTVLMNEFDSKISEISGNNIRIWDDFDRNKLYEWIDRWVDGKTLSEDEWFMKYYDKWWTGSYIDYNDDMVKFLNNDPSCKRPDFWDWFINVYQQRNLYP